MKVSQKFKLLALLALLAIMPAAGEISLDDLVPLKGFVQFSDVTDHSQEVFAHFEVEGKAAKQLYQEMKVKEVREVCEPERRAYMKKIKNLACYREKTKYSCSFSLSYRSGDLVDLSRC
jgi:hypothetical protein